MGDNMEDKIKELLSDKLARTEMEIITYLDLGQEKDKFVIETLHKMCDNYELVYTKRNKYMLFSDSEQSKNFVKGTFMDTQNDYGFVKVEGQEKDIFIHGSKTNGAIDGDLVLVKIIKQSSKDKKCEGEITKIIAHAETTKVGQIYHYQEKMMVQLDDKKFKKLIMLEGKQEELDRLVDGDKVLVSLVGSKEKGDCITSSLIRRIGNINDPDIDILSIIAECGFNTEWPEEVEEQLKSIPTEIDQKDIPNRKDLRDEVIFTIDGDDTKDIDDAISIKKINDDSYILGVHIADVSYYVTEGSPLDLEAHQRGTSVYLTDRVIPMLPHQLSNGICSLNPDVDRFAISCIMNINSKGQVTSHDLFPSIIRSRIQMTYKKVNMILEKDEIPEGYEPYADDLKTMLELSKIIRAAKVRRGVIDFDTDEAKILVDETGHPTDVVLRERGTGEKLIEDFMIAANETVATHMQFMELPSVYRVHGEPSQERLVKFMNTIANIGINIKADLRKVTPYTIQGIIEDLKKHKEFKVLSTTMLSCMDKAIYDMENIGHFGIASKCYTHFTSPIRRYPDTTLHRLLRNFLFSKDGVTDEKIRHFTEILPEACEHSSLQERNSIECERQVDSMKMAEYMMDHIGEEYTGMISGVTSFGFFVQLDNLIEGLVPIMTLDGYLYDQEKEMMVKDGQHVFRLGQVVKVKVTRADKDLKEIDFELLKDDNGNLDVDFEQNKGIDLNTKRKQDREITREKRSFRREEREENNKFYKNVAQKNKHSRKHNNKKTNKNKGKHW